MNNKSRTNRSTFLHNAALLTALGCLLVISSSSFAADDDYLRSLEAESNNAATSPSEPSNNYLDALSAEAESSSNVSTSTQHDETYNKQLEEMELFLKNNKPSTYKFYKKLSKKNKARVFEHYAEDKSEPETRLSHLKKQVMDAYFKK